METILYKRAITIALFQKTIIYVKKSTLNKVRK